MTEERECFTLVIPPGDAAYSESFGRTSRSTSFP
jgi:hypothetical protein